MNDENKKIQAQKVADELDNVRWGETKQERILDRSPHHKSERHVCKGPQCGGAFDKDI
jgi:hypothetical protein